MMETVIPLLTGLFGTILKGLGKALEELKIGEWAATIQTTALVRLFEILLEVNRPEETWSFSDSRKIQSVNVDQYDSLGVNNV